MKTIGKLFLVLLCFAGSASASTIYRAIGATCADSNHTYIPSLTNPGEATVGPKVCADEIVIEVTLSHDYVPGSRIKDCMVWYFGADCAPNVVHGFVISDGAFFDSKDFVSGPFFPRRIEGTLPADTGLAELWIRTPYSSFRQNLDGTWTLGVEQTVVAGECALGAIEGPIPGAGVCNAIGAGGGYAAIGRIEGWQRVPEPASLLLGVLGLGLMRAATKFKLK